MRANFETGMKVCSKCKESKSIEKFSRNASRSDGLSCWCKECRSKHTNREKARDWYMRNRERRIAYVLEYQKRNASKVNEYMKAYNRDNYALDTSIIYAMYRKCDNRIMYIGESLYTLNNRINRHRHCAFSERVNSPLYVAIREFGMDAFGWVVLSEDYSEVFTEHYFISLLQPEYNVQSGNKERQRRVCNA